MRLSCFKYIRLCARPQPRAPCRSRATVRGLWRVRPVGAPVSRGLCAVRSWATRRRPWRVPRGAPSACALPISTGKPRNQGAPVTPSDDRQAQPCAVGLSTGKAREPLPFARRRVRRRMIDGRNRAPCAACAASAPCVRRMVAACAPRAPVPSVRAVRRMVAACAPRAPVPSVARSSRCAVGLSASDLDGQPRNQGASRPPSVTPSACPQARRVNLCRSLGLSALISTGKPSGVRFWATRRNRQGA